MHYDAVQGDERDEVWQSHEGIEYVCKIPYQVEAYHGTEIYCDEEEHALGIDTMLRSPLTVEALRSEILHGRLTVVAPTEYCREGKCKRAESKDRLSYVRYLGESHLCQYAAVRKVDIRICYYG